VIEATEIPVKLKTYSKLDEAVRVLSYIYRFINNLRYSVDIIPKIE